MIDTLIKKTETQEPAKAVKKVTVKACLQDPAFKELFNKFDAIEQDPSSVLELNKKLSMDGVDLPSILFVDLTSAEDMIEEASTLTYLTRGKTYLIGLGTENDVKYYRDLIALGFQDYLANTPDKPLTQEDISTALNQSQDSQKSNSRDCKTIGIVGVRGGCGATSLALNLSWILAEKGRGESVLVDVDPHYGTLALNLDLEPSMGFSEALRNPDRIDDLFVKSALVPVRNDLKLISLEENLDDKVDFGVHALGSLLFELQRSFSHALLDIPRTNHDVLNIAANRLHEIIVVSDLSLAGARDTLRLCQLLKSYKKNVSIRLVLNQSTSSEISKSDFEKTVGYTAACVLPHDSKTFLEASRQGRPVMEAAPNAIYSETIESMMYRLIGRKQPEKRQDLLGKAMAWLNS